MHADQPASPTAAAASAMTLIPVVSSNQTQTRPISS